MINTRYIQRNHVTSFGASIKTPLPAEDPNFPSSNLLDADRKILYACPATGGNVSAFFDIGSSKTTDHIGLLGYTIVNAAQPGLCVFNAGNVFPKDGTWVSIDSVTIASAAVPQANSVDFSKDLVSPVVYRYWELAFQNNFQGFIMSKPLIGQTADLGLGYASGTSESMKRSRIREPGAFGRSSVVSETGPITHDLELMFPAVTDTLRTTWRSLAQTAPFLLLHPILGIMEVDLAEDELQCVHRFGPPNLWDINVRLEQLP
jgi:hypothetical protein